PRLPASRDEPGEGSVQILPEPCLRRGLLRSFRDRVPYRAETIAHFRILSDRANAAHDVLRPILAESTPIAEELREPEGDVMSSGFLPMREDELDEGPF